MTPVFEYQDIEAVVVDGPTTREPTYDEAIEIGLFLRECERREGHVPLGVGPVPGVGDVWFRLLRRASVHGEPA